MKKETDPNAMPEEIWAGKDKEYGIFAYCHSEQKPCHTRYIRSDLAPTSQWRDIKDAPRDGTEILGYHKRLGTHLVYWGIKPRNNPNFFWISSYGEIIHIDQPTHWQPIIPPTKDLADAEGEKV